MPNFDFFNLQTSYHYANKKVQAARVWHKLISFHLDSADNIEAPAQKRGWIVILLLFTCIAALVLLWNYDPADVKRLTNSAQIDSLITHTFDDFGVTSAQIRVQSVEVDSLFTRKIYNVRVPSHFSKTSFHLRLHEHSYPFSVYTTATVQFPERNLRIHLLHNDTVQRSVYLNTDTRLNLSAD